MQQEVMASKEPFPEPGRSGLNTPISFDIYTEARGSISFELINHYPAINSPHCDKKYYVLLGPTLESKIKKIFLGTCFYGTS